MSLREPKAGLSVSYEDFAMPHFPDVRCFHRTEKCLGESPSAGLAQLVEHLIGIQGATGANPVAEIGRASCRERVSQYVSSSGVGGQLKRKAKKKSTQRY